MLHLFLEIWAIVALAFVLGAGPFGYWFWAKRTALKPLDAHTSPLQGNASDNAETKHAVAALSEQNAQLQATIFELRTALAAHAAPESKPSPALPADPEPGKAPPLGPPTIAENVILTKSLIKAVDSFEPMALSTHSWPTFLSQPQSVPDDLTAIPGITPALQEQLYQLGVFHYAQIASWSSEQVSHVDTQLGSFRGAIVRDRWQAHAERLHALGKNEA
jgi:NADH-quinone oxidoreductase subunit E